MNILNRILALNPLNKPSNFIDKKINSRLSPSQSLPGYSAYGNFQRGVYDNGQPKLPQRPVMPAGVNLQQPINLHPGFFQFPNGQRVPFQDRPMQGSWQFPDQIKQSQIQLPIYRRLQ